MQTTQDSLGAAAADAGSKITLIGSAGSVIGWFNSNSAGMWLGILIGLVGLWINWHFKREDSKLKREDNRRKQEAHEAWMKKLQNSQGMPLEPVPAFEVDE